MNAAAAANKVLYPITSDNVKPADDTLVIVRVLLQPIHFLHTRERERGRESERYWEKRNVEI
jgi:hypothetical protein